MFSRLFRDDKIAILSSESESLLPLNSMHCQQTVSTEWGHSYTV